MRIETIVIHSGYEGDPTTKAVAVPIYQTVAYAFDSADHGAALFNLEAEGYRYSPARGLLDAILARGLLKTCGWPERAKVEGENETSSWGVKMRLVNVRYFCHGVPRYVADCHHRIFGRPPGAAGKNIRSRAQPSPGADFSSRGDIQWMS